MLSFIDHAKNFDTRISSKPNLEKMGSILIHTL